MRIVNRLALLALVWAPSLALAQASPFSADMVVTMVGKQAAEMQQYLENLKKKGMKVPDASGSATYRMYVSGLKMRLDMSAGDRKSSMLADLAQGGKSYRSRTPTSATSSSTPRRRTGSATRRPMWPGS